jgi:ketosteroid isomerase-like protein
MSHAPRRAAPCGLLGARTALLVIALLVGGVSPAAGQQQGDVSPAQEAAIEAAIRDLSTQWSEAYLKRDTSILERIWAREFVYVEPSGHRFTKAEGIAALAASADRLAASAASSVDVRVYGGGTVAVDIGDYRERGRDKDGVEFERASRFTNVWVLRDGRWQCVSGHASVIP